MVLDCGTGECHIYDIEQGKTHDEGIQEELERHGYSDSEVDYMVAEKIVIN